MIHRPIYIYMSQGLGNYNTILHFYCFATEAGFYSDVVEFLPVDPASCWTGKIFRSMTYTYRDRLYIHVQGDNSLLTKINEKVLKSEQSVCSQRILYQIKKKLPAIEARRGKFFL